MKAATKKATKTRTTPYDTAEHLRTPDEMAAYLDAWLDEAPDPLHSHPSAEHYRPILVAAGAAQRENVVFPVEGFEHGTIARRCVQFD